MAGVGDETASLTIASVREFIDRVYTELYGKTLGTVYRRRRVVYIITNVYELADNGDSTFGPIGIVRRERVLPISEAVRTSNTKRDLVTLIPRVRLLVETEIGSYRLNSPRRP